MTPRFCTLCNRPRHKCNHSFEEELDQMIAERDAANKNVATAMAISVHYKDERDALAAKLAEVVKTLQWYATIWDDSDGQRARDCLLRLNTTQDTSGGGGE